MSSTNSDGLFTKKAPLNAAIIGSGNIGTDLLEKALRSEHLNITSMVGIDPDSDGLKRAKSKGIRTFSNGVKELVANPIFADIEIAFDATSARAHLENDKLLREVGIRIIDLTPAAIGPYVVPAVNMPELSLERNVNMVTCGGQATIPIVAAISKNAAVPYAEIVASIASKSAGPGTRHNIDEFTQTTARAVESVGGATRGKAMIVLNPADPPLLMRNTVYCLALTEDAESIKASVSAMADSVRAYVPGYRLKQDVQCEMVPLKDPRRRLLGVGTATNSEVMQVSVFLEVEGAGDYLPPYAGNLDIMTSAAIRVGNAIANSELGDFQKVRAEQ